MAGTFDPYYLWLGIPPHEQPPHHYRLLGLATFEANAEVISQAADRQMAFVQMHKSGPHSAESQKLLNELSSARLCLLNPAKKAAYDAELKRKLEPAPSPAIAPPVAPVASSPVAPPANPFAATGPVVNPFTASTAPVSTSPARPAAAFPMPTSEPPSWSPSESSVGRAPAPIWRSPAVLAGAGVGVVAVLAITLALSSGSAPRKPSVAENTAAEAPSRGGPVAESTTTRVAPAVSSDATSAGPSAVATGEATTDRRRPRAHVIAPNPSEATVESTSDSRPGRRPPRAHVIGSTNDASSGDDDGMDAADDARGVARVNGGLRWPPRSGYDLRGFAMNGPTQQLVAESAGFAALMGVRGSMFGFGEELTLARNDGFWTAFGKTGQGSFGGELITVRSPIAGVEFKEFSWRVGDKDVKMIPAADGFCVLTSITGRFLGEAEWVRVDVGDDGVWRLRGNALQDVAAKATAVIVPRWSGETTFREWGRRGEPVELMPVREGLCYLSGVGGAFLGDAEWVGLRVNQQRWYLQGGSAWDSTFAVAAMLRLRPSAARRPDPTPASPPGGRSSLAELATDFGPDGPLAPAAPRSPRPSDAELTEARRAVEESFGAQIAQAQQAAARANVARILFQQGRASGDAPPTRYALLDRAAQLAAQANETTLAWDAWDELAKHFETDVLPQKAEALVDAAARAKTADDAKIMAQGWLMLLNQALAADQYDQASRFADRADQWVRKSGDDVLGRLVRTGRTELSALSAAYEKAKPAKETLASNPNDVAAAGVWGRFLCLYKNDFPHGLPTLAKSDGPLSELARREMARPSDVAARLALADAWWDASLAETEPLPKKFAAQRAARWYRVALPGLVSVAKKRVENRLVEYDEAYPMIPHDEWVDVLGMVDLTRHVLRGAWTRQGSVLGSNDGTRNARVAVPVIPAGEYDLRVKFVRRDGDDTVAIGLPVGDRHVDVALSALRGRGHALWTVSGRGVDDNPASFKPGALVNGREYTVEVKVGTKGARAQIEVALDGRRIIDWDGPLDALPRAGVARDEPQCLWLATADARVSFREARLRVRSGAVKLGTE